MLGVPPADAPTIPSAALETLAAEAHRADAEPLWPERSWSALRDSGALRWSIPTEYGGAGLATAELTAGMVTLASACVTTTFLLSQRESAIRLLLRFGSQEVLRSLLPRLARGEAFVTVGLSQLTTSRQQGRPALVASPADGGYRLDGEAPWATGAAGAEAIVLGANLPDGTQALFLVPTATPGLTVDPPFPLAALTGSLTAVLRCDAVRLTAPLAGPAEQVMGPNAGGGLETSALAVGLAAAATGWLVEHARSPLEYVAEAFAAELAATKAQLLALVAVPATPDEVRALRVRATRLALRATQSTVALAKGTGFVTSHPAQRWARQALFFLVWSCPRPAAEGILNDLLP